MDERTTEILKRFNDSWQKTEEFYDDLINNGTGFERLKIVRQFMADLKLKGYNNFFRLGTSVHTLIISRSVNHALRLDQKHIKIEVYDNIFEVILRDGKKIYRQYKVESLNNNKVLNLIRTLKSTLVD